MAYTRHTWINNQVPAINATHLNEMEAGIAAADTSAAKANNDLDALKSGDIANIKSNVSDLTSDLAGVKSVTDGVGTWTAGTPSSFFTANANANVTIGSDSWVRINRQLRIVKFQLEVNYSPSSLSQGAAGVVISSCNSNYRPVAKTFVHVARDSEASGRPWMARISTAGAIAVRLGVAMTGGSINLVLFGEYIY